MDKKLFTAESLIGLKNPEKSFPVNSDVGVLKWRLQTTEESFIPLTSECPGRSRLLVCREDQGWPDLHTLLHSHSSVWDSMTCCEPCVFYPQLQCCSLFLIVYIRVFKVSFDFPSSSSLLFSDVLIAPLCFSPQLIAGPQRVEMAVMST